MSDGPSAHVRPSERPIGIFDSGLGGLTVARAVAQRLPRESILYFGDTARVPYGSKSPDAVRRFSREALHYLYGQGVKAVVIACNTATAHALDALKVEAPVPLVGVVAAGARAAARATRSGRIGIIGTAGTIKSGAYDLAVRRLVPERDLKVFAQPCPLFVPLVEEGLADHAATEMIAADYLTPLEEMDVDVLVLGCTHYPILASLIGRLMGPEVTLVDSAEEAAGELEAVLRERGLLSDRTDTAVHRFTASDLPLRFGSVGRRFFGQDMGRVEQVHVEGRVQEGPALW